MIYYHEITVGITNIGILEVFLLLRRKLSTGAVTLRFLSLGIALSGLLQTFLNSW